MKKITAEELVDYKIFPFNIYNSDGEIVVAAGDNLTPGKLLQLRYISELYCDSDEQFSNATPKIQEYETDSESDEDTKYKRENDEDLLLEDNLINPYSPMDTKTQLELKNAYLKAFVALNSKIDDKSIKGIRLIRDGILDNLDVIMKKTLKKSQLKVIGAYEQFHGLNVALLSAMLATKMSYTNSQVADITLAALLHDIGKTRLPNEYNSHNPDNSFSEKNTIYKMHPELGYKILKNEMNMPKNICTVALEHHEKSNGTGYPFKISDDEINPYSKVVSICNFYDNLISGQTNFYIETPQEAVKKILELGSSYFSPSVLYSFVYMTNYHDDISVSQLSETGTLNW